MKRLLIFATALALASPSLAQVPTNQPSPPQATEDAFTSQDKDGDGALSLDEVKMKDSAVTQADFDAYDTDKDKALSKMEFAKWVEARTTPPASAPGQ